MSIDIKNNNYPNIVLAGFWIRFFAFIIDLIMVFSVFLILRLLVQFFGMGNNLISIGYLKVGLYAIVFPVYFVFFTKFTNGQTLGKMIFGLRVVCFIEEALTWKTIIIRELFGRYIQQSILLLYLIAAFTPKKQHLADVFTDTSVISERNIEILNHGKMLSGDNQ